MNSTPLFSTLVHEFRNVQSASGLGFDTSMLSFPHKFSAQ